MVSSTAPDAWTLSPQLTAASNLWKGTVFAYAPFMSEGFDFAKGPVEFSAPMDTRLTSSGKALHIPSPDWVKSKNSLLDGASDLTIAVFFIPRLRGEDDNDSGVFGNAASTSVWNDDIAQLIWRSKVSTPPNPVRFVAGGLGIQVNGETILDKPVVWIGRKIGPDIEAWANGAYASGSGANTTINNTESAILGNYYDLSTERGTGIDVYWAFAWDRAISNGEVHLLLDDPFVMLRPAGF